MSVMPDIAITKPAKNFAPTCSSRVTNVAMSAINRGAMATITPTFEALVMVSAMFSIKKYNVTPVAPASANSASTRAPMKGVTRWWMTHSARKPSMKRKKRISIGVTTVSSTFVDTNVMPQTNTVRKARRWPLARPRARRESIASCIVFERVLTTRESFVCGIIASQAQRKHDAATVGEAESGTILSPPPPIMHHGQWRALQPQRCRRTNRRSAAAPPPQR